MVRVAYAGQNGRPYTPVGRVLIERGLLDRGSMSMQAIRAWMKAHPREARGVMETDQSYVFFREQPLGDPALGSRGSEGVPLTPGASVAVDPHVHPLGAPIYIAAMRPDSDPAQADQSFETLLIAQDTGGAIRGPARGDVFWGFGKAAESIAGRMKASGRMFVLLPKNVAARLRPDSVAGALMSRRRTATEEERALFEAVLGGAKPDAAPTEPPAVVEPAAKASRSVPVRVRPTGVDGRTAERLRKGTVEPDATLDLHGLTEDAAHRALSVFLRNAPLRGARLVLIVTGKGLKPSAPEEPFDLELDRRSRGVLKAMVPRWLQEPALVRLIADVRSAHRRHGGAGALYVYLRKERPHP